MRSTTISRRLFCLSRFQLNPPRFALHRLAPSQETARHTRPSQYGLALQTGTASVHHTKNFIHCALCKVRTRASSTATASINPETNSQTITSALFVRRGDARNVTVVDIDLNLDTRLGDLEGLKENLRRRNMQTKVDVDTLASNFKEFTLINQEFERLEGERDAVTEEMKSMVKQKIKNATRKKELIEKGRVIKEQIKGLQTKLWDLEAAVMLTGLRLPNRLSESTPDKDEVIEVFGEPSEKVDLTYEDLFKGDYRYCSSCPSTYFMAGAMAHAELEMLNIMSQGFRRAGLTQFACPDMTRAVITEACGGDMTDPQSVLNLQLKSSDLEAYQERGGDKTMVDKWDLLLSLCGGSSLPAFMGFLCKMNLGASCLPQQWFSVGRHYKPVPVDRVPEPGFFNTVQTSQVSLFAAAKDEQEAEEIFEDYMHVLWELYSTFGIHMRFVKVGATELEPSQSFATKIEAWLPSEKRYITVAWLGMYDDFLSRKLMAKWSENVEDVYTSNYLHVIYGVALDFPSLLLPTTEANSDRML